MTDCELIAERAGRRRTARTHAQFVVSIQDSFFNMGFEFADNLRVAWSEVGWNAKFKYRVGFVSPLPTLFAHALPKAASVAVPRRFFRAAFARWY